MKKSVEGAESAGGGPHLAARAATKATSLMPLCTAHVHRGGADYSEILYVVFILHDLNSGGFQTYVPAHDMSKNCSGAHAVHVRDIL